MVTSCSETEMGQKAWLQHPDLALSVGTHSWCQEQIIGCAGPAGLGTLRSGLLQVVPYQVAKGAVCHPQVQHRVLVCVDCMSSCFDIFTLQLVAPLVQSQELQSGGNPCARSWLRLGQLRVLLSNGVLSPLSLTDSVSLCLCRSCPGSLSVYLRDESWPS